MQEITITPATPKDAPEAANLTFMAYHKYSYDLFGQVGETSAVNHYQKLWLHGNNRFGYNYSYLAKVKGETIALMTCYPSNLTKSLVGPTIWQLARVGGLQFILHFFTHLSNFYYFSSNTDLSPDELYVATLAVAPEYRGLGIGAEMLRYARKLTREQELKRCTLHVSAKNENGIRFYERNGFTKSKPTGGANYFRMVYSI